LRARGARSGYTFFCRIGAAVCNPSQRRGAGPAAAGRPPTEIKRRIQLNLHNVLEKTRTAAPYYEPDGSLALARIEEGRAVALTHTLEF
jgi:hypothetical protein